MTQTEAQDILDLHNKFRCAVDTPPLVWNAALACQAQKEQDRINAFDHADSYALPIPAGENLATGTNVATAAWMWFTEYVGPASGQGHFTAMVWKSTTEVGCGIGRDGRGVIRCQYARAYPNLPSQLTANVPAFLGEEDKFTKCDVDIATVKRKVQQFSGWGILHPISPNKDSLNLYAETGLPSLHGASWVPALAASVAAAAFAVVGVAMALRRRSPEHGLGDLAVDVNVEEAALVPDSRKMQL